MFNSMIIGNSANMPSETIEPKKEPIRKIHVPRKDYYGNLPPIVTNQKIKVVASECSSTQNDAFMQCMFYNEFGDSRTVKNVSFINYEVKTPFITQYRAQNGVPVNRVEFGRVESCEIMGHNKNGLTVKCGTGFADINGGEE